VPSLLDLRSSPTIRDLPSTPTLQGDARQSEQVTAAREGEFDCADGAQSDSLECWAFVLFSVGFLVALLFAANC
jgi:hypothetical protein